MRARILFGLIGVAGFKGMEGTTTGAVIKGAATEGDCAGAFVTFGAIGETLAGVCGCGVAVLTGATTRVAGGCAGCGGDCAGALATLRGRLN
jgi:hypothetical protein